MKLDRFDHQILQLLQEDGRINNQDLADRIGLSPSPCLRRVRALEEAGLILGYRAHLDARKLGLTLIALIHISMDVHTPERFAHFEAEIAGVPEVLECLLITGQEADYQLKVTVTAAATYYPYRRCHRGAFELCAAQSAGQNSGGRGHRFGLKI